MALVCLYALVYDYREEAVLDTFLSGESILGSPNVARSQLVGDVLFLDSEHLGKFNVFLQFHCPIEELESLQLHNQDVWELFYPLLMISTHNLPIVLVIG